MTNASNTSEEFTDLAQLVVQRRDDAMDQINFNHYPPTKPKTPWGTPM